MRLIRNLTITNKIMLGMLLVAVIGSGFESLATIRLAGAGHGVDAMYNRVGELQKIAELRNTLNQVRIASLSCAVAGGSAADPVGQCQVPDNERTLTEVASGYRRFEPNSIQVRELARFDNAWGEYRTILRDKLLPLSRSGRRADVIAVDKAEAGPLIVTMHGALDALSAQALAKARQEKAAADSNAGSFLLVAVLMTVLSIAAGAGVAIGVARLITRPLRRCAVVLDRVNAGDLTARTQFTGSDEVGQLAATLDASTTAMADTVRIVRENADKVASAANELSSMSIEMTEAAKETSTQAGVVSESAAGVSRNVQSIASGAEEMGVSIQGIANNAFEAARVSAGASQTAHRTNATVSSLVRSSAEIDVVVQMITSIAAQTNLLALNATIEAARAGALGKGFAVVASEVKALAQETGKATEDITSRIAAVQHETEQAIAAISEITRITDQINDYTSTIAAAVEEQTITASEITRNISQAASGSTSIATTITGVAQSAGTTTASAMETQYTAQDLASMADVLRQTVANYQIADSETSAGPSSDTNEDVVSASAQTIFDVHGVVKVTYFPEYHAASAQWATYARDFRPVFSSAVAAAGKAGARAWIIDLSLTPGAVSMPDQEWLTAEGFSLFVEAGIQFVINVTSARAITRASTRRWSENGETQGVPFYEAPSVAAALSLAREKLGMPVGSAAADAGRL